MAETARELIMKWHRSGWTVARIARRLNLPLRTVSIFIDEQMKPQKRLTLQMDDVWAKGTAPAILRTQSRIRYERKEKERFNRKCIAAKEAKRLRRAARHGFVGPPVPV